MAAEGKDGPTELRLRKAWSDMIEFMESTLPLGFRKSKGSSATPRVRFEAIAVGTALAIKEDPTLPGRAGLPNDLSSAEFRDLTTSDAANNRSRVLNRIEYVRDRLLGK